MSEMGASAQEFTVHPKELDWLGKSSFQCFSVIAGELHVDGEAAGEENGMK